LDFISAQPTVPPAILYRAELAIKACEEFGLNLRTNWKVKTEN
jgi:hypothetical protein